MNKALTIGLAMAVLAASLSFVAASSIKRVPNDEPNTEPNKEPMTEADALPAYEILTVARSMGFKPLNEPSRRGPYYVFQAVDQRGQEVRVVADARFGDIVSVAPISPLNGANTPNYQRGARIIHVPQPGGRDQRASVNERDEPALSPKHDEEKAAPAPPRRSIVAPPRLTSRTTPRWAPQRTEQSPPPQRRSDAPPPPPPGPRRAVLSAPPPPAEGPTPIRPTPRFNAKADSGEKFQQPATPDAPPPPSGYSPPALLPQGG